MQHGILSHGQSKSATGFCPALSEAVGDARANQPGVELGLASQVRAADRDVEFRLQKELLDVEIDAPMLIQHVIEPDLQSAAERVLDMEGVSAAGILIVEDRVVQAGADIGLEGAEIGKVVLQRECRREHPDLADLAQPADRPLAVDIGVGGAENEFGGDVVK